MKLLSKLLITLLVAVFFTPADSYAAEDSEALQAQSSITIPNRRLTWRERQDWIADYRRHGPSGIELEFIPLLNAVRREHNLSELQVDDTLMMAARFYAQTMSDLRTGLGHNRGPYADFPERAHGASANIARAFGGNLSWNGGNSSWGRSTAQGLITGWMNSPGHRAYIVSPEHRFAGIGHFGGFSYLFLAAQPSSAAIPFGTENCITIWSIGDDMWSDARNTVINISGTTALNPTGANVFPPNRLTASQRNAITGINFLGNITVTGSMAGLFENFSSLFGSRAVTGNINVDAATDMSRMFRNASSLERLDFSGWDTRAVTNMTDMFTGTDALSSITFGGNFVSRSANSIPDNNWRSQRTNEIRTSEQLWDYLRTARSYENSWSHTNDNSFGAVTENTATWTVQQRRQGLDGMRYEISISGGTNRNRSNNPTAQNVFPANRLSAEQRAGVRIIRISGEIIATGSMAGLFSNFSEPAGIAGITNINTSGVFNMNGMFRNASSLTSLDLSGWDTRSVLNMTDMFTGTDALWSITFGGNFVSRSANSLPGIAWQNNRTNAIKSSAQLWDYLRTARTYSDTWRLAPVLDPGDLNGNRRLDQEDAQRLRQVLTGQYVPQANANPDFNGDGEVNIMDLTALRLRLVGR